MSPAQANPSPPLNSGQEEQNRDFDVSRQEQTKPPNGMKRASRNVWTWEPCQFLRQLLSSQRSAAETGCWPDPGG